MNNPTVTFMYVDLLYIVQEAVTYLTREQQVPMLYISMRRLFNCYRDLTDIRLVIRPHKNLNLSRLKMPTYPLRSSLMLHNKQENTTSKRQCSSRFKVDYPALSCGPPLEELH